MYSRDFTLEGPPAKSSGIVRIAPADDMRGTASSLANTREGWVMAKNSIVRPTRPVLRYHGGKWRLAPWVIGHFPEHRTYVEPFGGAASVLLQKPRSYSEIYNDLDREVVNVFRVLRRPQLASKLKKALALTPFAREEFEEAYSQEPADQVERARRTLIKSFMAFSSTGLFSDRPRGMRTHSSRWNKGTSFRGVGRTSGPSAASDWATWHRCIDSFTERLTGVVVENRKAVDVISQHDDEHSLHYVDPPYVLETRGDSRVGDRSHPQGVYRHEMSDADHRVLARVLSEVRGMVVLSGYPCPLYDELYASWMRVEKPHRADHAKLTLEVLWLNAAAADRLQPSLLEVMNA